MKLFLAIRQKIYLLGLIHLLEGYKDIQITGVATESVEMMFRLREDTCQVLIIDETIFKEQYIRNGSVRPFSSPFPVLILLYSIDPGFIFELVRNGFQGLILSNEEPELFPSAIRAVYMGDPWMSHPVFAAFFSRNSAEIQYSRVKLTKREKQILGFLLKDMTNKDIAKELRIAERTVEYHIKNLLEKLGVRSRVGITIWAENQVGNDSIFEIKSEEEK
jgi:DNA-binding NarL/FixJ family response regulator